MWVAARSWRSIHKAKKIQIMTTINNIEDWNILKIQTDSDDCDILFEIASYYDFGYEVDGQVVVEIDKNLAFNLYEKASKKGHIDSKIRLADFYSSGENCQLDIELAIKLYEEGIKSGSGIAANNLATIYRDKGNFHKAFELYKLCQELDKSNSIKLAYCYYYGIGTTVDRKAAFEIFEKIATDKSEFRNFGFEIDDANYYLGLYYLEGNEVRKSLEKAREYFEKANVDNDHRNANELLLIIGRSI